MKSKFLLYITTLSILGCAEPTEIQDYTPTDVLNQNLRALIINEGQFGYGTASITGLGKNGVVVQDMFRTVNDRPLGDVAQSATKIADKFYIPSNNSKFVKVLDSKTFEEVETMSIDLDVVPMYVQHLGGDSIIVTDQRVRVGDSQSPGKLMIMDINHGKERSYVRRTIDTDFSTFQMRLFGNKLFVAGDNMTVFDLNNLTKSGQRFIKTKSGAFIHNVDFSKIVVDKNDIIWTLGQLNFADQVVIFGINPETEEVISELNVTSLGVNDWVGSIDVSVDKKTIYCNGHRKIFAIDVDKRIIPTTPIINPTDSDGGRTVYNMCVSKENTIFVTEVKYGSLSRARIYEYDPTTGERIFEFKAGIFPHYIYFE